MSISRRSFCSRPLPLHTSLAQRITRHRWRPKYRDQIASAWSSQSLRQSQIIGRSTRIVSDTSRHRCPFCRSAMVAAKGRGAPVDAHSSSTTATGRTYAAQFIQIIQRQRRAMDATQEKLAPKLVNCFLNGSLCPQVQPTKRLLAGCQAAGNWER